MPSADEQAGAVTGQKCLAEDLVDVALPIFNTYPQVLGMGLGQLFNVTETLQPAKALLFADIFLLARAGAAGGLAVRASPAVSAEQAEEFALRTDRESGVQEHAQGFAGFGADVP